MNVFKYSVILLLGCALSAVAYGQTPKIRLNAGVEHSDNVQKRSTNARDETIGFVGVEVDYLHEAAELNASLQSDFQFFTYTDDVFEDEFLANAVGSLQWWLMPDRLSWEIHDSFGQLGIDPFVGVTPENREDTNFFRTGPDLHLRIGASNLVVGARFVDDSYEKSPIDNQRLSAAVRFVRPISPGRTMTVGAMTERTEFDDKGVNSDFDRQSFSAGFSSVTSRSDFEAEVGVSQIHDRFETFSTLLSRLRFERNYGEAAGIWIEWNSDYSDAGRSFADFQNSEGRFGLTQNVIPVSEPFEQRSVELGGQFGSASNRGSAALYWIDEGYEQNRTFDRQQVGVRFGLHRDMTRTLVGGLTGSFEKSDFGNVGTEFDDFRVRAYLQKQFSAALSADLYVMRDRRSSDSVSVADFTDNRAGIELQFSRN